MKEKGIPDRKKLMKFLLDPLSYPHKPRSVKHIQTHISDVFIVSPYVYKVKKPVDFGFLDFTTLNKRKYYCDREVELNSRLCEIYLGVEEISLTRGIYRFGKGDKTMEYAVKMNRLPDKYFLKKVIRRGNVNLDDLRRIIRKLVEFYISQSNNQSIGDYGRPEGIKIFIHNNISLVRKFIGKTISPNAHEAIRIYNDMFFEKNPPLFQERIKKGFIKDCHGDLHLNNINISPNYVCIHDRIEFNDRFRYIDIASDIAFLAMDLDFNGRSDFADFVVSEVSKNMQDDNIFTVIDFYKCYRAFVRGKIESLRSEEPELPEKERKASLRRAREYFTLSLKYALFGSRPTLIVIFGLIGTGKSTLAKLLSRELRCEVISSDRIRKEMLGIAPTERKYEEFHSGVYSKNITERVYKEIARQGIQSVQSGKAVILDASFSKTKYRKLVINKAKSLDIPIFFIQAKAAEKTIRERLIKREEIGKAFSDGRLEIFGEFKEGFDPPVEIPKDKHVFVKTEKIPQDVLTDTLKKIISNRLHL